VTKPATRSRHALATHAASAAGDAAITRPRKRFELARFECMPPFRRTWLRDAISFLFFAPMLAAIGLAFSALGAPWLGLGLVPLAVALAAALFSPLEIVVGRDGALIRWTWLRRFIPHREIASVSLRGHPLFERYGGVTLQLGGKQLLWFALKRQQALRLERELNVRRRLRTKRSVVPNPRARIAAHHALTVPKRLRPSIVPYREPPAQDKLLWRILRDPRHDEADRAAAALALPSPLRAERADYLQRIASGVVCPELRRVFEAVATGDMTSAQQWKRRLELAQGTLRARLARQLLG
jgi:hypothetical protein